MKKWTNRSMRLRSLAVGKVMSVPLRDYGTYLLAIRNLNVTSAPREYTINKSDDCAIIRRVK